MSASLYSRLQALGVPMDSHESDLYVQATPEVLALLATLGIKADYFRNQKPPHVGELWLDIPFAFEPWWEARIRAAEAYRRANP